jgi:molecular chaperone GrpE
MMNMSLLSLAVIFATFSSASSFTLSSRIQPRSTIRFQLNAADNEMPSFEGKEITSDEITKLRKKIENLNTVIASVREERTVEEAELAKLEAEFGDEITRIKKEFARIKERSVEEAVEISNKAKIDALKEVLPITDNYYRAKSVYEPITAEGELKIMATYDEIFVDFMKVIEGFGVSTVTSLGQKYDYNFMEAIMTSPSTEYANDIVCKEYQVGYKMGEKCVRPAMVVVSTGPGPSAQ